MAEATITLCCDTRQLYADLELLAEFSKRSLEVHQRLLGFGDFRAQLRCVPAELDFAPGAGQLGVRLEFADGLADLVAAVRAGQFD